jgi:ribosomal-protein-alanine N-acetyltransferase
MSGPAVVLEPAAEADAWALARLEERSYSSPWSVGEFLRAVRRGGRTLLLRDPRAAAAEEERGIRAYCVFQVVADEVEIHNLAVHPEHRRQGLGRRILGLVLALAASKGARQAHLEVRAGNAAALGLYQSEGFEIVGGRREYYRRPVEDAVLLRRVGLDPTRGETRPGPRDP